GRYLYRVGIIDQIKEAKKRYNPFRNIIIRHYLKYVTKIFSVSNSLKELLEINNIRNVETIYNGINLDEWQIDKEKIEKFKEKYNLNDKKVIIFSARLIEAKGGDQLLESLSLVNDRFSDFALLVVGKEWAYTEKMKKIARDFGIENKIIFTGLMEREKLKIAYNSADISVFPSLCFESFGMGNLEAMACKKPVVSSWFGGPKEVVVDKETGYLIDPNNIELMAEKIIELLKDSQKSKTFGEKGYERVRKNFSLEKQVEETLKWYK
ncbi:MAG: glycosyltransferase family 4 protein, partial [Nanoarchaeota archaeon]|nr:glycosyltransferase family 4 protein [Nanoarchaeota archaeon]